MFKKILGLILCVATLASMVTTPAYAAKESTWKQDMLSGLGIYQENPVTYDGFITSIAGFFYEDTAEMGSTEIFARSMGMIESDEEYNGQNTLTIGNALKIAVTALGYKAVLGSNGNYVKKASEIGIAKGISSGSDAKLKASVAVDILYEMIDTSPLVRSFDGGVSYEVANDETLLSINRDIYEVKGLLTGTETTSLYGPTGCAGEDNIIIGDVTYYVGDASYDKFLGKHVTAYVQETDYSEKIALYVGEVEGRNNVLILDSEAIESINDISDDLTRITYHETSKKEKTVKIAASPRVIYNGMFLHPYFKKDLFGKTLELIDIDGDKEYDVIKVTAYQTMIVEAIDSVEKVIKNRYRFGGCLEEIKLNVEEDSDLKLKIYDSYGAEVDFSAIKVDDVLSVARSHNGKVMEIYIADNAKMAGTITGLNNRENIVAIDNEEYKTSEDFRNFLTATNKTLKLADLYTFYFDHTGKIAYIKAKTMNDYNVLAKIEYDDDKNEYLAVHMDMNGDWYTTPIYKKASFDGVKPNSFENYMEILKNDIKENPEIVIFKYNSKNQIINVDTADGFTPNEDGENEENNDSAFCSVKGNYYYRANRYFQSNTATDIIYPENDAKVIVIPSERTTDKRNWEIYNVGSFFKADDDITYAIEYFNPDPFGFSDLFVVKESSVSGEIGMSSSLYVVTGKRQALIDGEPYTVIEGCVDGFMNLSFLGSDENSFIYDDKTEVQLGDVINFTLDSEGKISKIKKECSLETKDFKNTTFKQTHSATPVVNAGTIKRIDYEAGKMVLQIGADQVPFRVSPNMQVTVYYGKEGCLSKSLSSLNQDDKILIRTSWGNVQEIVCTKN